MNNGKEKPCLIKFTTDSACDRVPGGRAGLFGSLPPKCLTEDGRY